MLLAMLANAAAASDVAAAMATLANDLQTAQTRCRNALTDCETHQSAVQQAQAEAEDHARDANNYSDGAALSPDPHEQSRLRAKAAAATDQANAARQKASQAQAELEDSERAGRQADSDFQTAASAASRKIAAAQSRLTKITLPRGGAPVPAEMTPSDIKLAQYLYLHTPPTIVGGGDRADRIQLLIDELKAKGDTLNAGIIQAYDEMEKAGNKELTNPPTGNPLDAFDGLLHLLSIGLIKLGDPNSVCYQDGELLSVAALLTPDGDLAAVIDEDLAGSGSLNGAQKAILEEHGLQTLAGTWGLPKALRGQVVHELLAAGDSVVTTGSLGIPGMSAVERVSLFRLEQLPEYADRTFSAADSEKQVLSAV